MWKVVTGLLLLVSTELAMASVQTRAGECARELFRGMLVRRGYATDAKLEELLDGTVKIERQDRASWSVLNGEVFLASYTFQRPVVEAWVIAVADHCAVVGGDLETIVGLRLDPQDQVALAVHEYNRYVRASGATTSLSSPENIERYALAVLELVLPSHQFLVVAKVDDVPMKTTRDGPERQRAKRCLEKAQATKVDIGSEHSRTTLSSWEEIGGVVASNSVLVFPDGQVAVSREVLCEQLGHYRVRGRF